MHYPPTGVNEPPQRSSINRQDRLYSILSGLFPH
jgi:hypothetical protein